MSSSCWMSASLVRSSCSASILSLSLRKAQSPNCCNAIKYSSTPACREGNNQSLLRLRNVHAETDSMKHLERLSHAYMARMGLCKGPIPAWVAGACTRTRVSEPSGNIILHVSPLPSTSAMHLWSEGCEGVSACPSGICLFQVRVGVCGCWSLHMFLADG